MLQSGRSQAVLTGEICLMATLSGEWLRAADGSNVESRLHFFDPLCHMLAHRKPTESIISRSTEALKHVQAHQTAGQR